METQSIRQTKKEKTEIQETHFKIRIVGLGKYHREL